MALENMYLMEQEHDKRNHVKSGKDLEQEKPAVYQEYSDRDSFRDFKRIKKLMYWMEAESYRPTL